MANKNEQGKFFVSIYGNGSNSSLECTSCNCDGSCHSECDGDGEPCNTGG
jgi:hypothetical protein